LAPETEVCVDLKLVSGRYYEDVGALPADSFKTETPSMVASVLQGLTYWQDRGNTPSSYYNTRGEMCRAAMKEAIEDLEYYWSSRMD